MRYEILIKASGLRSSAFTRTYPSVEQAMRDLETYATTPKALESITGYTIRSIREPYVPEIYDIIAPIAAKAVKREQ